MEKIVFDLKQEDELTLVAQVVLEKLTTFTPSGATVLCLLGDLGAGKTTFVQTLARALGITQVVTSPTFGIMKRYSISQPGSRFTTLIHMDAYRIESEAELAPLRFSEVVGDTQGLICIEWADRIASALPDKRVTLVIENTVGTKRTITLTLPKH
jgi:tRNA threonylcarbamoyladenosine biosynthesis protein TsaE